MRCSCTDYELKRAPKAKGVGARWASLKNRSPPLCKRRLGSYDILLCCLFYDDRQPWQSVSN